jgi:hypothetical protein
MRPIAMRPIAMRPIAMRPIAMRPIAMRPSDRPAGHHQAGNQHHPMSIPFLGAAPGETDFTGKNPQIFYREFESRLEIPGDRQAPRHIAMPLPHVYVGLYENTHPSHRNHVRR